MDTTANIGHYPSVGRVSGPRNFPRCASLTARVDGHPLRLADTGRSGGRREAGMGRALDLTGQVFGRLTVVGLGPSEVGRRRQTLCRCECGDMVGVQAGSLRGGRTLSCGCLRREVTRDRMRTHGMTGSAEYTIWIGMRARCRNPQDEAYSRYGGRGITVCAAWGESFEQFLRDMGQCPTGLTLDRINNDGNYEPGNCRWATYTQQSRNRRSNVTIEMGGVRRCVAEWAPIVGIRATTIYRRIRYGWSGEDAITIPPGAAR